MIDLYTWTTPTVSRSPSPSRSSSSRTAFTPWSSVRAAQFAPDYVAINPNSKIPALVDHDGPGGAPLALFESGAILQYLARKTSRLLPKDERAVWDATRWLFVQVAGVGPMFGQACHFGNQPPIAELPNVSRARHSRESVRDT